MSLRGLWAFVKGGARSVAERVGGWLSQYRREVHVYPGLVLVGYGAWEVWRPAAWIVVGAALVLLGLRYVQNTTTEHAGER